MTVEDLYAQLDKQYADQFPNMTEREKVRAQEAHAFRC